MLNPPPSFPCAEEIWLSRGEVQLRVQAACVPGDIRGEVLLTHGLGEHAGRYSHVASAFASAGLRVWAYDLRGHGRSGGKRGDAARYDLLLEDLQAVYQVAAESGRPVFVFGHSMGGQIALNFLLGRRGVRCQGAIISSPWLRLAFDPPLWQRWLAWASARLWPGLVQGTSGLAGQLSRDLEHLQNLPEPDLTHHLISVRLFLAVQREGRRILERAGEFTLPLLLLHGASDAVTSAAASKEFFARAGSADKRLVIYPDALHELHNDLGREQVLQEAISWMGARLTG